MLSAQMVKRLRRQRADYPVAYDVGKAVNAAAKASDERGFGAQWAGQGAPLTRSMGAAELVQMLEAELAAFPPSTRP